MGFLTKLPAGMRLIKSSGVIVLDRPLLASALADSPWLDREGPDGRTERQRFGDALRDLDRLATGWRPAPDELHGAPKLSDWRIRPRLGGIELYGIVRGHPHIPDGHHCSTSPLIAIDAVMAGWARTVSRWYLLDRPYREEDGI